MVSKLSYHSLPTNGICRGAEHGHSHGHAPSVPASKPASITSSIPDHDDATPSQRIPVRTRRDNRSDSYSFSGHPVATRASLVQVAQDMALATSPPKARRSMDHLSPPNIYPSITGQDGNRLRSPPKKTTSQDSAGTHPTIEPESNENTPLLLESSSHSDPQPHRSPSSEEDTLTHNQTEQPHGHGHNHSQSGSMNMRALLLHVLGDALGNVGVIATGLIIWLTTWSFKYYFDPIISLVITVIIFSSALPLGMSSSILYFLYTTDNRSAVRSTSFVLLQGVPSTVSIEEVRSSILEIEGVLSLHELHIWQLSETKIIASVHVLASRNHDFMPVAANIRKALHLRGIHSSTIQPEYYHTRALRDDHLKVCERLM